MSSRGVGTVIGKFYERHILPHVIGCEFRLKPARDSDVKPATIPG